jgi:integrase
MKLTKTTVDKLPIPEGEPAFHRDDEIRGFGVKVFPSGVKSFFLEKRVAGKVKRITIGRYGEELTAEKARKEAQKLVGQIATGGDPVAEKQEAKLKAVTLRQVFTDYLNARSSLKPTTVKDYRYVMDHDFVDWLDKPILAITKDKVAKRHKLLGEKSEARANIAMRVLRALFNFAMGQYEDTQGRSLIFENPVKRISQTRAWYRVDRRQSVIKAHELRAWFTGVMALDNETLRDYLLLMVLTGLRRQEAATLKWADVDLTGKTITVRDPKNRRDHTLPLSDYLFDLLDRRKADAVNAYVFPGTGVGGYIVEPRKQITKVTEASGINFTPHDLRRTFITIAESLDIPAYALKRLLNHASGADVTAGYIVASTERLREPMQKITDYVLKAAGLKPTAEVIELKREATA